MVDTLEYEGIPIDLAFARPLRRHGQFCICANPPRYRNRVNSEERKCIEGVTLVKRRAEKRPSSFCKNRAISENGLFKATKETRDEASRIFYSKNQFMLLGEYGRETLGREELERRVAFIPSAHLERINRVTIYLYSLMYHYYSDPYYTNSPNRWQEVHDGILSFVKETFLNERLHVKLLYTWYRTLHSHKRVKWLVRRTIERASEYNFGSLSATI